MSTVSIRPVVAADEPFLRQLFLAGRPELAGLPAPILDLQLRAQQAQYDHSFPGHTDGVIEAGGPVGRCWTWQSASELRILDLVVLNAYRGRGIGRSVLAELARQAAAAGLPLRLSVWTDNAAARRLYESCGLTTYDEQDGYLLMQLLPPAGPVS